MFHLQNSAAAFLRKFSQSRNGAVFLISISVHDVSIGVLGQPSAGLAAAVAAAVGLAGQFFDEGVFLLLIGFFRLIRNALIPAIFSQGLPHGSHDLRKLRVTLVLGGR